VRVWERPLIARPSRDLCQRLGLPSSAQESSLLGSSASRPPPPGRASRQSRSWSLLGVFGAQDQDSTGSFSRCCSYLSWGSSRSSLGSISTTFQSAAEGAGTLAEGRRRARVSGPCKYVCKYTCRHAPSRGDTCHQSNGPQARSRRHVGTRDDIGRHHVRQPWSRTRTCARAASKAGCCLTREKR
jgi:hypothetical protein